MDSSKDRLAHGRTKVLYVGGFGRSGSTLLARMLGQVPGFAAIGELEYVWERYFIEDQPCGCGAAFSGCGFWREVVDRAYGGFGRVDLEEIIRLKRGVDRMRHIPRLVSPWKGRACAEKLAGFSEKIGALYAAIEAVSGASIVVDSSKVPSYAYALANVPGVELYLVHLVRDSRAVAHSWLRKKARDEKTYMDRHGPVNSSVGWMRSNALLEPLRFLLGPRYARVRYEDLIRNPKGTLGRILALLGEDAEKLPLAEPPLVGERAVKLGVDHIVEGNPMRFLRGTVDLRLDEEWREGMRSADRRLATALSWPLLLRYGYDLAAG